MAISSPLLEASIDGAHGVLLSIQGGSDLGLFEINEAARLVQEAAHPEANIIFGAVIDDALGDEVRVTVIAAGFDSGSPTVRRDARALGQISGSPARPLLPTSPSPANACSSRPCISRTGCRGGKCCSATPRADGRHERCFRRYRRRSMVCLAAISTRGSVPSNLRGVKCCGDFQRRGSIASSQRFKTGWSWTTCCLICRIVGPSAGAW
jgi:hypothetical protein